MGYNTFGGNIGDALIGGLRGLTEWKMQELKEKKINQSKEKAREFYRRNDIDPGLADLPQTTQDAVVKEFLMRNGYPQNQQGGQQGGQQLGQQSNNPSTNKPYWSQGVQQQNQQNQQGGQQNQQGGMEDLLSQLMGSAQQGPQSGMDRLKSVLTEGALQELMGQGAPTNPAFQPIQGQNNPELQPSAGQNNPALQPSQPRQGMNPRRLSPEAEQRNRIAQERLDLSKEKNVASNKRAEEDQDFKRFQAIKPFLHQKAEVLKAQQNVRSKVREALKIIKEHGHKFPGIIKGNLPGAAQSIFIRDPEVRKYMSLVNEIVLARGHMRKGVPSKYKLMMEEMAKANINQPIKTQEDLLNYFKDDADKEFASHRFMLSQKGKNGEYPLDIEQRVSEYESAQEDPLDYPQYYRENAIYEDDNGKKFILKKGEWKPWER
jgi:hypothetical protein